MPQAIGSAIALGGAALGSAYANAHSTTTYDANGNAIQTPTLGGSLIGGIITLGAGLLGGLFAGRSVQKVSIPKPARVDYSREIRENLVGTIQPIPVVYGLAHVPGIRIYAQVGPTPNFYLYEIFAFCEGQIEKIYTLKIDDADYTDSKFSGKLSTWQVYGSDSQGSIVNDAPAFDGPSWTSAHRLRGLCYTAIKCNKDAAVFPRVPSVSAVVYGRLITDIRTGTVLATATGNPALCIYDYLTNARYGCGIAPSKIDLESFIEAANYCEEKVLDLDGTQKQRYELSGALDTSRTVIENLRDLLQTCRGMLAYTAGKYRLIIDKPEVPVFEFDEDSITGSWTINRLGKRFRKNRIEATYRNQLSNWQPDLQVVESANYQSADGEKIVGKIDMPLVVTNGLAYRLAFPLLKQSRLDRRVEFTATMAALQVAVGDVVTITHSTPGYDRKLFRVMRMTLLPTDEVQIAAEEYNDRVYDLTLNLYDSDTANPFEVEAPSNLTIRQAFAGSRNTVTLKWQASDSGVAYYQAEVRYQGQPDWRVLGKTLETSLSVGDFLAGLYDFRVKAVDALNQSSDYAVKTARIVSSSDVPADVSGLSLSQAGNLVTLSWATNTDALNSGFYKVRHSANVSGAAWSDTPSFELLVPGGFLAVTLGRIKGTYLVKSVNIAGTESAAAASVVLDTGDDGYGVIVRDVQSPDYAGSRTDTAVVDRCLQLDSATLFDSGAGNFDSGSGNFDSSGGFKTSGSYQHAVPVDLGAILPVRLQGGFRADYPNVANLFDSGAGNFDSAAGNFDGSDTLTSVTQKYRTTPDNPNASPTWSSWQALAANDVTARGLDFKVDFSAPDANHNARLSTLEALVTMPVRADYGTLDVPAGGKAILYSKSFWSQPTLSLIIQDYQAGDTVSVTSQSATGFSVGVFDVAGSPASRAVTYLAIGAGYR